MTQRIPVEVIDMLSKGQYGASDTANTLKRVRNRQTRGYLDDSRANIMSLKDTILYVSPGCVLSQWMR